jgi:hypothetical protein
MPRTWRRQIRVSGNHQAGARRRHRVPAITILAGSGAQVIATSSASLPAPTDVERLACRARLANAV